MTQRETINAIKALGLIVRYSSEFSEWRVTIPAPFGMSHNDAMNYQENVAYYTDDAEDTLHTAQYMAGVTQ